jgi:hypothetical protein
MPAKGLFSAAARGRGRCDAGLPLRYGPPAKRLSTIPSCAGVMTRAACARARAAGVDLTPLLRRIGLTARNIENESVPLRVTSQIKCLNLMAEALGDRLLGFHVAQGMDLRRGGLLYYVAASYGSHAVMLSKCWWFV